MSNTGPFEPLPEARFKVQFVDGIEWVTVRASRNWFIIPFFCIWLTMWTFGGVAAVSQLVFGEAQLFVALWLVVWAAGWLLAASWLGWQLAGKLRLAMQDQTMIYQWVMPFVSKTKRYDAYQVRNLRVAPTMWPWGGNFMNSELPSFLADDARQRSI